MRGEDSTSDREMGLNQKNMKGERLTKAKKNFPGMTFP